MYASGIYGHSMATSYHGNQQTIISRLASTKPLHLRSVGVFSWPKSMLTHFQTQKQFSFVVDVSCEIEEWGGLREGLPACSCRIFCWWVQTASGSCHLLTPLGQTASGCRHVAALGNGIVNSLKADSMNEHVGDPWEKKEAQSNANMTNPAFFDVSLEVSLDQKLKSNWILSL